MSTTNTLRARIASELNRALSDSFGNSGETLATVVNREINSAIAHYESDRFRWNQVRNSKWATTTSGTREYSLPPDFLAMDTLKIEYNGNWIGINKTSFDEIDSKDTRITAATGIPSKYCIYGNIVRLYPAPNATMTLVASYLKRHLPTSCTGSYTMNVPVSGSYSITVTTTASHNSRINGWTTDGEELIRARAVAAVQVNYLNNATAIMEMQGIVGRREPYISVREGLAFQRLADETQDAVSTGRIKPSPI